MTIRHATTPVRVARLAAGAVLGVVLVISPRGEAAPVRAVPAVHTVVGFEQAAGTPTPQQTDTGTEQSQGDGWETVRNVTGIVLGLGAVATIVGLLLKKRWRKGDRDNGDLDRTRALLVDVGVEARRVANLKGAATEGELTGVARLIPNVQNVASQHTGRLGTHLEAVAAAMTELVNSTVDAAEFERGLIAAATLADVPQPLRLPVFAECVRRQTRAADRLVTLVMEADEEARRTRR
ncbi:hypothetical protein ACQEWB_33215 [Streptomyces sp. CA-249302]|uniref:hypothetical protein n=1 Tax=Streptomyces sp. CA-249302 TaxID=3240058 RepID=UPI003D93DD8E